MSPSSYSFSLGVPTPSSALFLPRYRLAARRPPPPPPLRHFSPARPPPPPRLLVLSRNHTHHAPALSFYPRLPAAAAVRPSPTFSSRPASFSSSSSARTRAAAAAAYATMTQAADAFYALKADDNKGKQFDFGGLKGKVVVIVNVASKCGFTPQYEGLEALYKKYKDRGLEIIGFPCDQFGHQEPGSDEEIAQFCSLNYGVSFPIMKKIEVNGDNAHTVYQFLKSQKKQLLMERIKWNFEKFVVNRKGEVVNRFASTTTPDFMAGPIEELLAESA